MGIGRGPPGDTKGHGDGDRRGHPWGQEGTPWPPHALGTGRPPLGIGRGPPGDTKCHGHGDGRGHPWGQEGDTHRQGHPRDTICHRDGDIRDPHPPPPQGFGDPQLPPACHSPPLPLGLSPPQHPQCHPVQPYGDGDPQHRQSPVSPHGHHAVPCHQAQRPQRPQQCQSRTARTAPQQQLPHCSKAGGGHKLGGSQGVPVPPKCPQSSGTLLVPVLCSVGSNGSQLVPVAPHSVPVGPSAPHPGHPNGSQSPLWVPVPLMGPSAPQVLPIQCHPIGPSAALHCFQ